MNARGAQAPHAALQGKAALTFLLEPLKSRAQISWNWKWIQAKVSKIEWRTGLSFVICDIVRMTTAPAPFQREMPVHGLVLEIRFQTPGKNVAFPAVLTGVEQFCISKITYISSCCTGGPGQGKHSTNLQSFGGQGSQLVKLLSNSNERDHCGANQVHLNKQDHCGCPRCKVRENLFCKTEVCDKKCHSS